MHRRAMSSGRVRRPRRMVWAAGLAMGLAMGLVWALPLLVSPQPALAQQDGGAPRATPVGVAQVSERVSLQTVPVIGRLVARRAGLVASKVGGAVEVFLVDVGDIVKEGDLLARLDTETAALTVELASAEIQQREAALDESRSRLALAQQELQRLASLRRSAAFSQARFDDKSEEVTGASHAVSVAQALLMIAESRLALAEVTLREASIRAPYAGVVIERHTEIGAYVSTGNPVVSLLSNSDLEVEADIPFDLIGGLAVGDGVDVRLDDATQAVAVVRAIVPAENARTRTRPARFTLPAKIGQEVALAAGQSVTLLIPEGPEVSVLTVPKDAVITTPSGAIAFVVVEGVAQSRPLTLGAAVGDSFAVLDGLTDGETVVTRGNERLRPGQPVRATVPPSAGGTPGTDG